MLAPPENGVIGIGLSKDVSDIAKLKEYTNSSEHINILDNISILETNLPGLLGRNEKISFFFYIPKLPKKLDDLAIENINKFFLLDDIKKNAKVIKNITIVFEKGSHEILLIILNAIKNFTHKTTIVDISDVKSYDICQKFTVSSEELPFLQLFFDINAIPDTLKTTKYGFVPRELIKCIKTKGIIEEKFWYGDEQSAAHWQMLTDPSNPSKGYLLAKYGIELIEKHVQDIFKKIHNREESINSGNFIDLISFGVGTPEKDEHILRFLMGEAIEIERLSKTKVAINYYPFDISFPLLEYTLRYFFQLLPTLDREDKFKEILNIYPILGDFEAIDTQPYDKILTQSKNQKIAILLGNTIGNLVSETSFMRKIPDIIGKDGYLIMDVEFISKSGREFTDEDKQNLINQYSGDEVRQFVTHPLQVASKYLNKVPTKDEYSVHIEIVEEVAEYRFGNSNKRVKLTDVPNSKVVTLYHKLKNDEKILLAWSTKYRQDSFETALMDCFDIVHDPWKKNNVGLYLLKPK